MRRFILTGTPSAGKTTILHALRARGYPVVEEAATAVITEALAAGDHGADERPEFLDVIVARQIRLQRAADSAPGPIQFFDRSPVCTLALSEYTARPVTPMLAAELDRVLRERTYEPQVFFIRNLGVIEPTPVRRIRLEEALEFERIHQNVYRRMGFELVDVEAGPVERRVDTIVNHLRTRRASPSTH